MVAPDHEIPIRGASEEKYVETFSERTKTLKNEEKIRENADSKGSKEKMRAKKSRANGREKGPRRRRQLPMKTDHKHSPKHKGSERRVSLAKNHKGRGKSVAKPQT